MNVKNLKNFGIGGEYINKLKEMKIENLYPPQEEAIKKRLLEGENMLISAPTAAGKTLVAILAMIKKLSKRKCKAVYIVPLVALANEKYNILKNFFEGKFKVAVSVGDLDEQDPWLKDYDIIVVTSEKLDSLIRHGVDWIMETDLIIADEIHLLQDSSRGPTFEVLLTKLRNIVPNAQFLGLSASVKNAEEIADWLDAVLIKSDFRPVKLYEGVCCNRKVKFLEKDGYELESDFTTEEAIVRDTLKRNWKMFFFVSTRKNAESLAEKISRIAYGFLSDEERKRLNELSEEVIKILEIPTLQCKKLGKCIKNGVAFHHAGLLRKQKSLIEENFKNGLIKVICCTPTLAMGISFPADRVVIRDAKRYYPGFGAVYLPVIDYFQMKGRAGRPEWSSFGESILIAKTEEEAQDLIDHFIMGEMEEVQSKLASEPALRMHTLALISNEFCNTETSLLNFFSKTFFAFQYGNISAIEEKILEILETLKEWELIDKQGKKLIPTRIGKRVSELYIDPLTAHFFIECLKSAVKKGVKPFGILQAICNSIEMLPLLSLKAREFPEIRQKIVETEHALLKKVPSEWDLEFDDFLKSIKTAMMFEAWINESTENEILEKFNVAPGEFYSRRHIADWLIYSLQEIALLLGYKEILKDIRKIRVRMEFGIKEELIPFVRLKGIGRIRARKLYNSGITSLQKLREIPLESLCRILGSKVAQQVKQQIEQKEKKEERQTILKKM